MNDVYDVYNIYEISKYLKCSVSGIRNLVKNKSIPNFRLRKSLIL